MDRQVEIISMVERRRRCSNEQKLKILAEAGQPGATVSAVAERNGISRSQLYAWMKLAREGRMPGISAGSQPSPRFAPVRIENTPAASTATSAAPPAVTMRRRAGVVEIALSNGRVVRVEDGIEPSVLARLVAALDGAPS
jgi:transposase